MNMRRRANSKSRTVTPKSGAGFHASSSRVQVRRHYDKFLAGPVPWRWIQAASLLGGKALHVGLALWQRKGVTKSWVVRVSLRSIDLGFDRSNASRGLAALEKDGLVQVERSPGRALLVTIIDIDHPEGTGLSVEGSTFQPNPAPACPAESLPFIHDP